MFELARYSCSRQPRPVCQRPADPRSLRTGCSVNGVCHVTGPAGRVRHAPPGRGRDVPVRRRRATGRLHAVREDGYAGGPRVGWMPSAMLSSASGWVDATASARSSSDSAGVASALDDRKVPQVTGAAVGVTGRLHVGVVLMESTAHPRERHQQCRSDCHDLLRQHHRPTGSPHDSWLGKTRAGIARKVIESRRGAAAAGARFFPSPS